MIVIPWHEQMRGSRFEKEKCDGQIFSRVVARCTGVRAGDYLSGHELGRSFIRALFHPEVMSVGINRYLR